VPASISAAGTQSAYGTLTQYGQIDESAVSTTGEGLAHENRQPYQAVTFIIALDGIYPPRV
jgi:microcystin-dependent protein